jgi:hypothetical protein
MITHVADLCGKSGKEAAATLEWEESLPARFTRVVQAYGSRTALASDVWQPTY